MRKTRTEAVRKRKRKERIAGMKRHLNELARSVEKKAEEVDRLSALGLVRGTPSMLIERPSPHQQIAP